MLCAVCDEPGEGASCGRCGGVLELHDRFGLERLLGAGGQSRVYAARDRRDGSVVAVKIMSLARVREWKNVELFRRAAGVLAGLQHPGITKLVDYFEESRPNAALYCLVHEFIDGETLAAAVKRGLRFDEASGRALLVELLGILRYLHGLSPPVIHRDVKPSNLMRRRDGRLVLIDFDLVRDVMLPDGGATTTAGTAGYTPLEQYAGEALPASDLYAAGATLAALLSRKEPLELRAPGEQRLALRAHIHVGERLLGVLTKMVEPEVRQRYRSADEVLADLERPESLPSPPRQRSQVPMVLGAMAALACIGGLVLSGVSSRTPDAPATVALPPPPPAPPTPPRPPAPPAPLPSSTAPSRLSPAVVEGMLRGPVWDGLVERTRIQVRFTGTAGKLKGELTTFDANGRGRKIMPIKVEIATLGTLTLRARGVEDGVAVERTFYGELSRDGKSIAGTCETRYDANGSSYVTEDQWSVRRNS